MESKGRREKIMDHEQSTKNGVMIGIPICEDFLLRALLW